MAERRKVIVTGGAGYIGSHACLALHRAGYIPVTLDNLSNGHADAVKWGPLVYADIRDRKEVERVFRVCKPVGVMHFAGLIEVAQSVSRPIDYYEANVAGAINVIATAARRDVPLVFSSTCATFGAPSYVPMDEKHPQSPLNPYGRSKLAVETVLRDAVDAGEVRCAIMRYFNAAGACVEKGLGERHDPETHAIPLILRSVAQGETFNVFGGDYPTRDGTCVRDYIHVLDLADAHVKALEYLIGGGASGSFNLGTGRGTTVKELVAAISSVLGRDIPVAVRDRRAGDAPELVADCSMAATALGWKAERSLEDIIKSAARFHGVLSS
jgi:UDP-glucose 4-epimerase